MRYLATGQKKQDRSEQDAVRLFRERESVRGSPALGCSSCSRAEATSLGGCCDRIEAAAPALLARSGLLTSALSPALALFVTALTPPPPRPPLALTQRRPRSVVHVRLLPRSRSDALAPPVSTFGRSPTRRRCESTTPSQGCWIVQR